LRKYARPPEIKPSDIIIADSDGPRWKAIENNVRDPDPRRSPKSKRPAEYRFWIAQKSSTAYQIRLSFLSIEEFKGPPKERLAGI